MGAAYPELKRAQASITETLKLEEVKFKETLERGLKLLEEEKSGISSGGVFSGAAAFKLYDTYGFPLDLTQDILRGRDLTVDSEGFETAMERQREKGRESWTGAGEAAGDAVWLSIKERAGQTDFLGYEGLKGAGAVVAIVANGAETHHIEAGQTAEVVFDRTPFYAESGGQAGDRGVIWFADGSKFEVDDTQKRVGALHGHIGRLLNGRVTVGDTATFDADAHRRDAIRANHSATHLLHAALRHVLGPHVSQKGSLVEADRLRFDFSHGAPVTADELERIEDEVNAVIRQNAEATIREMAPADGTAVAVEPEEASAAARE
jgi:alanyl-tRNA synthetase